jgi:hypothetical protein
MGQSNLRGSGDIKNIADSVFIITGSKDQKTVAQDKARWGQKIDNFKYFLKDLGDSKTMIEYCNPEIAIANKITNNEKKPDKLEKAKSQIIENLQNNSGQEISRKAIIEQCEGIGTNTIDNALKDLVKQNAIESKTITGGAKSFWLKKD